MKQKKQKKQFFWLKVAIIGIALGLLLQFARAWTEPTEAPPGGNLGAPINTGAGIQTKVGTASNKADICVDTKGTGDKKCLGDLVNFPACTLAGGVPTMVGGITLCKFPGASCPLGWKSYLKYTETSAESCSGVTSGSHLFDNIDPATEVVTYTVLSYYDPCCYTTVSCPPGWWHGSWCEGPAECVGCTSTTTGYCSSTVRFIGCTPS
ncbi:MAG: hypothetical protein WC858_02050 [Parcubacteria group bacterium]|jgi:hypothetical protein